MTQSILTSQRFDVSTIVTCGYCRGTGISETIANGRLVCSKCGGDGRLRRRSVGTVEIYQLENNGLINSNNK